MNKKKKGFTLTELIVVMAVIAILAAVLIPSLTGYIKKAKQSKQQQEAQGIYEVLDAWFIDMEANDSFKKLDTNLNKVVSKDEFDTEMKAYYKTVTGTELKANVRFDKTNSKLFIDPDGDGGMAEIEFNMSQTMVDLYKEVIG